MINCPSPFSRELYLENTDREPDKVVHTVSTLELPKKTPKEPSNY